MFLSECNKKEYCAYCILFLLLAFPFFYALFANRYVPNTDETWLLQSAYRFSHGEGLHCNWIPPQDLASNSSNYLVIWPQGYSILIGLLNFTVSYDLAPKLMRVVVIIAGFYFWLLLSQYLLKSIYHRILVFVFVGQLFVFMDNPTDQIFFIVFPIISLLVLKAASPTRLKVSLISSSLSYLYIGFLVSLLISIRYQALELVLFINLWILLNYFREKKKLFLYCLSFTAIPIIVYSIIAYINVHSSGIVSEHTNAHFLFWWDWNWIPNVLDNLFMKGLLNNLFIHKFFKMFSYNTAVLIQSSASIVFAFLFILLIVNRDNVKQSKVFSQFLITAVLTNILFLLVLTFYFIPSERSNWTPIAEGRYYKYLVPLLLIFLFTKTENNLFYRTRLFKIMVVIYIIIGIFSNSYIGKNRYDYWSSCEKIYAGISKHIEKASEQVGNMPRLAIAQNPYINMFLPNDYMQTYRDIEAVFTDSAYVSKPTLVVIIKNDLFRGDIRNVKSQTYERLKKNYDFQSVNIDTVKMEFALIKENKWTTTKNK